MHKPAESSPLQPPPKAEGALTPRSVAAHAFRSVLSLDPLVDHWRQVVAPANPFMASLFERIEEKLALVPGLIGEISEPVQLESHAELVQALMSAVLPAAAWQSRFICAVTPYTHRPFFSTPAIKRLMLAEDGQFKGVIKGIESDYQHYRWLRTYWQILDKIYGIDHGCKVPVVRVVADPETGLDRYFRILANGRFLNVRTIGEPHELADRVRQQILDNIDNPGMLARLIPPQKFEFRGFGLLEAVDTTENEVLAALEKDLVDTETIFSAPGFSRLQLRMQTYFGRPALRVGISALLDDQILVLNDCDRNSALCLHQNSIHLSLREAEDSCWLRSVARGESTRIADLRNEKLSTEAEKTLLAMGMQSLLSLPLTFQDKAVGAIHLLSSQPDAFCARDRILAKPLIPLFSMAVKRGLEGVDNALRLVIQEKCTVVHPVVEWRFRQAALQGVNQKLQGHPVDPEAIVFNDVVPLYGKSVILGAAEMRKQCLKADLAEQLMLANAVMDSAQQTREWPLVKILSRRLKEISESFAKGNGGQASDIIDFMRDEVECCFDDLQCLGPRVAQAVVRYRQALDPLTGTVVKKRNEFESGVGLLTERLSTYLDKMEESAQKDFPHYFEKHLDDGIDYLLFMGAALYRNGNFSTFQLRNMVLWQMLLACSLARQAVSVQSEISTPLDTCHLIYYNPRPIAIHFRYDRKCFVTDNPAGLPREIIRSLSEKAVVKGVRERLAQPGRLVLIYADQRGGRELAHYVSYLQAEGCFHKEIEAVELEAIPEVSGLKALRIAIQLERPAMEEDSSGKTR